MKLLLKCPLNYSVVRNACVFDPNVMATKPQLSLTKFKRLVSTMNDCKRVKDIDCDDVIWQYQKFLEDVVQVNSHSFEMFNSRGGGGGGGNLHMSQYWDVPLFWVLFWGCSWIFGYLFGLFPDFWV